MRAQPILILSAAWAAALLVGTARGSAVRAGSDAATVVIAYVPSRGSGDDLYLAGAWARGLGWLAPVRAGDELWRRQRWVVFPGPGGAEQQVKTELQPIREIDETTATYRVIGRATPGLAVSGGSPTRPRRAAKVNRYKGLEKPTRRLLLNAGIRAGANIRVLEAWSVDLNGDRVAEALWTARSRPGWRTPYSDPAIPGHSLRTDYALVAVRYRVDGRWQESALAVADWRTAAPHYRILSPLDANADGRMEVFLEESSFEDHQLLAFEFDGRRFRRVLADKRDGARSRGQHVVR